MFQFAKNGPHVLNNFIVAVREGNFTFRAPEKSDIEPFLKNILYPAVPAFGASDNFFHAYIIGGKGGGVSYLGSPGYIPVWYSYLQAGQTRRTPCMLLLNLFKRTRFRLLSKQQVQNGNPSASRYTKPSKAGGISVSKRIFSFSSLFSLSALALYAGDSAATAGTLTTCNNGITISFMISTIATQIFLAVFIGRVWGYLKGKDRE